uniref:Uncharacterized protein n=1 Tax=viral metagenome TaxID=1070528 RepID=A0A6C0I1F6_9ZZZZ
MYLYTIHLYIIKYVYFYLQKYVCHYLQKNTILED